MLGNIGMPELVVILVIALVIFGAARLPEVGRNLGKSMGSFKKGLKEGMEESKERRPKRKP